MTAVVTLATVRYRLVKDGGTKQVLTGGAKGEPGADGADGAPGPVAGSDTQIVYNDGGAAAGSANLTWNKTTNTLYVGGAVSVSGGTVTASTPAINVVQTWNNAAVTFTGAVVNVTDTASAAASKLLDLQVGGVSKFAVQKDGSILFGGNNASDVGSLGAKARSGFYGTTVEVGGNREVSLTAAGIRIGSGNSIGWSSATGGAGGTWAESFSRPASGTVALTGANIFEQRNGANAQTFRLFGAYTDNSNKEWLEATFASNLYSIQALAAGTGTVRGLRLASASALYLDTGSIKFRDASGTQYAAFSSGGLVATTDNALTLGSPTFRYSNGYFGTSVLSPKFVAGGITSGDVPMHAGLSQTYTAAPSAIGKGATYFGAGGREFGLNSYRLIGFGYNGGGTTTQFPAYIGYQETSASGGTNGALIFLTRATTGDTDAPTVKWRITAAGDLQAEGSNLIKAASHQTTDTTVASLPAASASTRGQRRHVTDSTVAASGNFGATVAGGGSNVVPVFCTGAGWVIG